MRCVLISVLIILVLIIPANGSYNIDTSVLNETVSENLSNYIGEQSVENADLQSGVRNLLNNGFIVLKREIKGAFASAFSIISICALISVIKGFASASKFELPAKITDYAGVFSVLCVTVVSSNGLIQKCSAAVANLHTFSEILMPVYAIAAAVCKHPTSAVTTAGVSLLFTNLTSSLTVKLFNPLITVYAISSVSGAFTENGLIPKFCELVKWFLSFAWKALVISFSGYISISGIISAGTDAVAVKTAKIVISGAVPVVGSILAEASDAILEGASIVKNGIGIIGFLGVCAIILVPFVTCLAYFMVYKLTAAFAGSLCDGAVGKALENVSNAYGLALGGLGTCSAVMFISIVITSAVTML